MQLIYWLSLGILFYIYDGYLRALQLLCFILQKQASQTRPTEKVSVTVLITAHNEAEQIVAKIQNTLAMHYPVELLDVIVASDSSTDDTEKLVLGISDTRVRLHKSSVRRGKTGTQNEAIRHAKGEIIVFTDASTRLDSNFLCQICIYFSDPNVGAVDGHLSFIKEQKNHLSSSQVHYWNYELKLRDLESRLGLLAVVAGPCFAVRRSLLKEMDPGIGEDCIVPLDVVCAGAKVVHVCEALAYDYMHNSVEGEFRARVRMTARNWRGTWSRAALLNPIRHPGYAFALWSHKVLRWLSPFFFGALLLSALYIGMSDNGWYWLYLTIPGSIIVGGVIGLITEQLNINIRILGILYSFCLANIGFLIGLLKASFGKSIRSY